MVYRAEPTENTGDSDPYEIEIDKVKVEKIPFNTVLERAGLTAEIPESEKRKAFESVLDKVESSEYTWNGEGGPHMLDLITEARNQVLHDLGLQIKPGETVDDNVRQLMAEAAVGKLQGWLGERYASLLKPGQSETRVAIIEKHNPEELPLLGKRLGDKAVRSVTELFGDTRKDIALLSIEIAKNTADEIYLNDIAQKEGVEIETVEKIANTILSVYHNYAEKEALYRKKMHNPRGKILPAQIARDELASTIPDDTNNKTRAAINRVFDDLQHDAERTLDRKIWTTKGLISNVDATFNSEDLTDAIENSRRHAKAADENTDGPVNVEDEAHFANIKMREEFKSASERVENLLKRGYYAVTIPDSWIGETNERIDAVNEVKFYSAEEVDEWLKLLEETAKMKDPVSEGYLVNGLQVTKFKLALHPNNEQDELVKENAKLMETQLSNHTETGRAATITEQSLKNSPQKGVMVARIYGPDIEAERRFAQMYNNHPDEKIPVIIQLPRDIDDMQFERLREACEQREITNVIFQRLPVAVKNVRNTAQYIAEQEFVYQSGLNIKEREMALIDYDILRRLTDKKLWHIE